MDTTEIRGSARHAILALKCPGYYRTNYHCRDCADGTRQYCGDSNKTDIANIMVDLLAEVDRLTSALAAKEDELERAVEDIPHTCELCAHSGKFWKGGGCNLLNNGEKCNWTWRGAKKGEG
jgi:hypothetical protein